MIKNTHYTYDYFQPEEYRFSLDSVFLAQKVAQMIKSGPSELQVLDLCAGCGIIGLELSLFSEHNLRIDFLEVQNIYRPFFEKNVEMIYPDTPDKFSNYRFLEINYQQLLDDTTFHNHYDLIVCNPPYFFKGEGLLSPSDFKNRCRFFLDSDFLTLIKAIDCSLRPGASAFLLVRSGVHHGRTPLEDINIILDKRSTAKIVDKVRGTDIVEIRKKAD